MTAIDVPMLDSPSAYFLHPGTRFRGIQGIARVLQDDLKASYGRQQAVELRLAMESRIEKLCSYLNEDDAREFRSLVAAEIAQQPR